METQPLTAPPVILEKILQFLIPPAARETVVGDLREIYRGPSQYMTEALGTVPLVILSCAIRAANLPLLLLQGGLIYFCLVDLGAPSWHLGPVQAALATAAALTGLILCETYRRTGRPTVQRSIIDAILIAIVIIAFCPETLGRLNARAAGTPDFQMALQFVMLLPLAIPLLGVLRTLLIMQGDRELEDFGDHHDDAALSQSYPAFLRHMRLGLLWEALALLFFAVVGQVVLHIGLWFLSLCALVAGFLALISHVEPCTIRNAFALRAEYRRLFLHRQQSRRFLSWLWAAPVLTVIYENLIQAGLSTGRGVLVMIGSAALIAICFLIGSINRECAGRTQEKIGLLERRG
ncbi:MAG TPA: hypothetical protein VGM68_13515 [Rhizomicrobium sp.]|jgi:hypothetical protein